MQFKDLGLCPPILTALKEQGYTKPSPIQEKAIPPALAGRDILGCAQTGTGKTCAFAAPILQRLARAPAGSRPIRALILTPTRELAIQIGESFAAYGKHMSLRCAVIFGGVGQNPQVEALRAGSDILVATPGRLMDLYGQGLVRLEQLSIFVLDEADRMLDMGFIHDVRKILKWLPARKQTMLFSATMPPEIAGLAGSLLKDPVRVAADPVSSPVEAIRQSVCFVDRPNKTHLLAYLMETKHVKNALVFTRTKHGANKVARDLTRKGVSAAAIHGNKSQTARQQALADFKAGRVRCLVATDIAARGLDIEELSHVFNYNLPETPETYIHRIGRTGRAGREGEAIAFCDFSEKPLLKDIEKLLGRSIPVVEDHPFPMEVFEAPKRDRNGKIINEEDAEARAAARQLRQTREKPKQPVQSDAPAASQDALPEPAPINKSRRRKKPPVPTGPAPAPVQTPAPRAKAARPGALIDTGDSMPRTEFQRPNPLDSDVIMDATARLLSSRRSVPAPPPLERPKTNRTRNHRKKKTPPPASNAAQTLQTAQKKQPHPAPQRYSDKQRRSGPNAGRRGVPEPRRSQPKDSTEQQSLMKPYYLELDR